MTDPRTQAAKDFGVTWTPAEVGPGQNYWRCTLVDGPKEIGGMHAIFVEVLDANGQRAIGVRAQFWNGGTVFKASEPKPGSDYALDFPIFAANNAYGARMADGLPSDLVFGMGLIPFHEHVSYRLVFQLVVADDGPTPVELPAQGMSAKDALIQAQGYINYALGRLDAAR